MQYVVTSCFGKILNTRSKDIINDCMYFFNCSTISDTLTVRKRKFLYRYAQSDNVLRTDCSHLDMLNSRDAGWMFIRFFFSKKGLPGLSAIRGNSLRRPVCNSQYSDSDTFTILPRAGKNQVF